VTVNAVAKATLALLCATAVQAPSPVGVFDGHGDVGHVQRPGSVSYDPQRQEYVIAGSGQNMWGERDDSPFRPADVLIGQIRAVVARLDLHRVPGAGHWSAYENAPEVNRLLLEFFRSGADEK